MNGTRACDNGRLNAPVIDTPLAATAIEHSPLTSGAFPSRFRWRIKASKTGAIGPTQGLPAE
jgi:hypothetical protein